MQTMICIHHASSLYHAWHNVIRERSDSPPFGATRTSYIVTNMHRIRDVSRVTISHHAKQRSIMPTKTRSAKPSTDVKLSSVYATYAQKHDIDTTSAAKRVRSRMRANFDK